MQTNPSDLASKQDVQRVRDDLHSLEQRFEAKVQQQEHRLLGKLQELEDRMVEKMRDMQTEVLRAFHDWGRTMEMRVRATPHYEERLVILEDRVSKLECRERPLR